MPSFAVAITVYKEGVFNLTFNEKVPWQTIVWDPTDQTRGGFVYKTTMVSKGTHSLKLKPGTYGALSSLEIGISTAESGAIIFSRQDKDPWPEPPTPPGNLAGKNDAAWRSIVWGKTSLCFLFAAGAATDKRLVHTIALVKAG